MSTYQIVVHEYNNSSTGHVNIEFRINGVTQGWYGADAAGFNVTEPGLSGGIYDQMINSLDRISDYPNNHKAHTINLSQTNYLSAFTHAAHLVNETLLEEDADYDLIGKNCVDFANDVLQIALNLPNSTLIDNYMELPSLAKNYAWALDYVNYLWDVFTAQPNNQYWEDLGYELDLMLIYFQQAKNCWSYIDEDRKDQLTVICNSGWASPIALDLNGDGIETISLDESAVSFDITGDGIAERTGWLSKEDGFLALDRNNDGIINDVGELFGGGIGDGVRKLQMLDSNGDGRLDDSDDAFSSLLVWQDSNSDGISQAEELFTLKGLGLTSIDLAFQTDEMTVNAGNLLYERSSAEMSDGRAIEVIDVYFRIERDSDIDTTGLIDDLLLPMSEETILDINAPDPGNVRVTGMAPNFLYDFVAPA